MNDSYIIILSDGHRTTMTPDPRTTIPDCTIIPFIVDEGFAPNLPPAAMVVWSGAVETNM